MNTRNPAPSLLVLGLPLRVRCPHVVAAFLVLQEHIHLRSSESSITNVRLVLPCLVYGCEVRHMPVLGGLAKLWNAWCVCVAPILQLTHLCPVHFEDFVLLCV